MTNILRSNRRRNAGAIVATCVILSLALHAAKTQAKFLPGKPQICKSHLADGQPFTMQRRSLVRKQNDRDVFTDAVLYYAPRAGAFFWRGQGYTNYTKEDYLKNVIDNGKLDCGAKRMDVLLLQDGEWTDFFAQDSELHIFHSGLRADSLKQAWRYVAEHPDESSSWFGGKWLVLVSLREELGADFFRPENLRLDARPYSYNSLEGVHKINSGWQVEIRGADPPNRAWVLLDSDFHLLKVTRTSPR